MGLCEALVEATLRRANGREVTGIRVRVGGHPVDPEVIDQGFRLAAAGTVAEHAAVDVVCDPMMLRCRDCGQEASAADVMALVACPACGGVDVVATGSEQVVLESIAVKAPASSGAATSATGRTDGREQA